MTNPVDALCAEIEETRKRLKGHAVKALELQSSIYAVQDLEDAEESCCQCLRAIKPPPLRHRP